MLETSLLLLLGVVVVKSGPGPDGVDEGAKGVVDPENEAVVDTSLLVNLWVVSVDSTRPEDVVSFEIDTKVTVTLVWFAACCWRRSSEGKMSPSTW